MKIGDKVWVRMKGYPWWPAKVASAETVSDEVLEAREKDEDTLVWFYGSHNYTWVKQDDRESIIPYEDGVQHENQTKRKDFIKAVREAKGLEVDEPKRGKKRKLEESESEQQSDNEDGDEDHKEETKPKKPKLTKDKDSKSTPSTSSKKTTESAKSPKTTSEKGKSSATSSSDKKVTKTSTASSSTSSKGKSTESSTKKSTSTPTSSTETKKSMIKPVNKAPKDENQASLEDVTAMSKKLDAACNERDVSTALNVLKKLEAANITLQILQETKIGKTVNNKAKKIEELADISKRLVAKWKTLVTAAKTPTENNKISSKENNDEENTPPTTTTADDMDVSTDNNNNNNNIISSRSPPTLNGNNGVQPLSPVPSPSAKNRPPPLHDLKSPSTPNNNNNNLASPPVTPGSAPKRVYEKPIPSLDNETRDLCVKKFVEIFYGDVDVDVDPIQPALELELVMWSQFGKDVKKYRDKLRSLSFNLNKNTELRRQFLTGDLSAERLATMSVQEMATKDIQAERAKAAETNKFLSMAPAPVASTTDRFKCGKCGKRECTYFQMQTRSADEPMTTFVTCVSCNNRWKF